MKGCANANTTWRCLQMKERPTEVEVISQSYSKFEVTPSHWEEFHFIPSVSCGLITILVHLVFIIIL